MSIYGKGQFSVEHFLRLPSPRNVYLVKRGGAVKFFVGSSTDEFPALDCALPIVVLEGVADNDYPPQKKSFAMFRWMEQVYGNT